MTVVFYIPSIDILGEYAYGLGGSFFLGLAMCSKVCGPRQITGWIELRA